MSKCTIESKETSHETIRKFEADRFLVKHQTFRFNTKKEAEDSPLASQLFKWPYVETVYIAQNFIAVEISEKIAWKNVEEEIAQQIRTFFDTDQPVVNPSAVGQKVPITVYTESTTNGLALKFVCNIRLVIKSAQFIDKEDAGSSPLARALFEFPYVNRIFFDQNYITITKTPKADWFEISLELREFIRTYLQRGQPVMTEEHDIIEGTTIPASQFKTLDPFSKEVIKTINDTIQVTTTRNGGKVKFHSYNPETLQVEVVMEGTYSHPPVAQNSLKTHLEHLLTQKFPEKIETVQVIKDARQIPPNGK